MSCAYLSGFSFGDRTRSRRGGGHKKKGYSEVFYVEVLTANLESDDDQTATVLVKLKNNSKYTEKGILLVGFIDTISKKIGWASTQQSFHLVAGETETMRVKFKKGPVSRTWAVKLYAKD